MSFIKIYYLLGLKKKFVKAVLKRTIIEKQDNLVRIRFDFYYADKMYRELFAKQDEYQKKKARVQEAEKKIATERAKTKGTRDKELIVRLEDEVRKLRDEIRAYEKDIQQVAQDKKSRGVLVKQAEAVIDALEKCLKNKELLEFFAGYEKGK